MSGEGDVGARETEASEAVEAADSSEPLEPLEPLFMDAATRVSTPNAFDTWYYNIEDKLGQGTVGMGVCLVLFIVILVVAIVWVPI